MRSENHRWGKILFLAYCIWMLWLLYGQRLQYGHSHNFREYLEQSVNLRPFRTIGNYWYAAFRTSDSELLRHIVINLVGNVVMFVPLGYLLPLNWAWFRRFRRLLALVAGIIITIELLQMLTMLGSLDVDDIILNLFGCILGYWIWNILHR